MTRRERLPRWPTLARGTIEDHGVFGIEHVERRSPRTGRVGGYKVLHAPDWVNVVARTSAGRLVLVEQFRHGVDALTLEIPGGAVDPGESHADAAARELREETGYTGATPRLLGQVHPNPAIQTNTCSTWLVEDARRTQDPSPDEGEHLAVIEASPAQVDAWVRQGEITHSLVIAALFWLQRRDRSPRASEVQHDGLTAATP